MSDEVDLRLIEPRDAPLFDGFYERCFETAYRSVLDPTSLDRMLSWVRDGGLDDMVFTDLGKRRTFGAISADSLAGTVSFAIDDRIARVANLYVAPCAQRRGIGSALLSRMVTRVPALHYLEVRVLCDSRDAIRFYEALGFEVFSIDRGEMAPDVIVRQQIMLCPAFVCSGRLATRPRHPPGSGGVARR